MSVAEAVRIELETSGASGPLAATAMVMACELDEPSVSATAKSNCAKVLLEVLDKLREEFPPAKEVTALDAIANQWAGLVRTSN